MKIGILGTGASAIRALGRPPVEIKDPVTLAPSFSGPHGRAWPIDLDCGRRTLGLDPANDASLGAWIVEAPEAHPVWHSYIISLAHLRPLSEGDPPFLYLADATHEVLIWAMSPEANRREIILNGLHWIEGALHPPNFGGQFIEVEDHLAITRVTNAIQEICDGKLNPDTDYLRQWIKRFGHHMIKERYR